MWVLQVVITALVRLPNVTYNAAVADIAVLVVVYTPNAMGGITVMGLHGVLKA
ncbi:hypothetical protein [Anaplasma ovis]|uniref:hypothetical protein n=1 Tax=Anaplasma ovis TaxID=142058 RepID=UPI001313DE46|nr:hypothetical protein [Anaplasma ovis]